MYAEAGHVMLATCLELPQDRYRLTLGSSIPVPLQIILAICKMLDKLSCVFLGRLWAIRAVVNGGGPGPAI
jgi:hypothetical protein